MEPEIFDSIDMFDGTFPQMGPMLESVWRTITPATISERDYRGKINIVSNRVGLFSNYDVWLHLCRPRAIYSRLRSHSGAYPPRQYPRALFTCRVVGEVRPMTLGAQLLMNGKLVERKTDHENIHYIWHWLRALASFYTCTNNYSKEQDYCMACRAKLTKKEQTLIYLNILGRKLNGRGMA